MDILEFLEMLRKENYGLYMILMAQYIIPKCIINFEKIKKNEERDKTRIL